MYCNCKIFYASDIIYILYLGSNRILFKGSFTNYVDTILAFFDHLTHFVDIFYLMNIDKKSMFVDYLPPISFKRSL